MIKTILITGASSGIGEATARQFAAQGWNIILIARRFERLEAIKTELESQFSSTIHIFQLDVRDRKALRNLFLKHKNVLEQTDVLVNNAGLALGRAPFHEGDEQDWETMIDTNLKGLIYMTKEISVFMVAKRSGHIINISSTAARDPYQGGNVYSATKYAVDGLTQSLRIDLLPHQIKVTSITPGMVETEFSLVRFHGDQKKAKNVYNSIEPLLAQDIADAIYYVSTRPKHVCIGDLLITCTAQATSNIIRRAD